MPAYIFRSSRLLALLCSANAKVIDETETSLTLRLSPVSILEGWHPLTKAIEGDKTRMDASFVRFWGLSEWE